ncbi:hypothetical protein [Methylocucumis oryzae]|uniref:hypothetical protein n=1 Tax=Methylocucumis oryzae TaxID=1632867 RepID=UPI0010395593|nr:hypothetical protein [Methylocucumis oryzae]
MFLLMGLVMSVQSWIKEWSGNLSRRTIFIKTIGTMKHNCFLLPIIIFTAFFTNTAKAVEYHWEYGGGPWRYFSSYDEACGYHLEWLQKQAQSSLNIQYGININVTSLAGRATQFDFQGSPKFWECRYRRDQYFPSGQITTSYPLQAFGRSGDECVTPKTFKVAFGSCASPTDDTKNPSGDGRCGDLFQ